VSGSERQLYLALGAIVAAVLAAIWLTGAVAGLIFGAGWTSIGASELAVTALNLPSHLGDPRAAWPRAARATLPGAAGFYVSAVLILSAICGLAVVGRRFFELDDLLALGPGGRRAPSARWASRRDLAPLRVPAPQRRRLTLGWSGRALLAAQERQSVIAFAPTESHKTTGLAIPALLEWQGPVLATSIKSDLLIDTVARRQTLGEVMVFDPALVTGLEPSRATPLWGAGTWRGAMRVAHWLAAAARTGSGGLQDADFWYAAAEKLLAPLLFAAAASDKPIGAVVTWLDKGIGAKQEVEEILSSGEGAGESRSVAEEREAAQLAWDANWHREPRQRSSIYTTAETITAAFADPRVRRACSAAEYTPAALLDGEPNTLYLCAPAHEQQRLRPLFSMMVRELISVVYESSAATGEPIDPPLLLVLDELANIAPIPNLDEVASTGAGQGIQLLSIFQDMAQIKSRYGESTAQTITNNHRAKLFGSGISDPDTLAYISRVVGTGEFEHRSDTADDKGGAARTQASIYRELTPSNVVREAKRGTGLLVYGHLPPAKIKMRRPPKRRTVDARDLPSELPTGDEVGA
jgi:type IV secretion system protein VirD4